MLFAAAAISHYNNSNSISENYKKISKNMAKGSFTKRYKSKLQKDLIKDLRDLFSHLFEQLVKAIEHTTYPNVEIEVLFKYKNGEDEFTNVDSLSETTTQSFVSTQLYRNKSRFEPEKTVRCRLPSYEGVLHTSTMLLFHKVNENNELIQPRINHHLINHHSENFQDMRSMFHQDVFKDRSDFHFCILGYETLNQTSQHSTNDKNLHSSNLMRPLDSNQESEEIDSSDRLYMTKPFPTSVFTNKLLPFLSSLDGLNMFSLEGMKYLDKKLSSLGSSSEEYSLLLHGPQGSYNSFFDQNNDLSGSSNMNSELVYQTFCSFRKHVQSYISFAMGTVEGIHRMYCLNEKEVIKTAHSHCNMGDTVSYSNSFHSCVISNLQVLEKTSECDATSTEIEGQHNAGDDKDASTDDASNNDVLEESYRELRLVSKTYYIDKERNMKSSAFDTIMSLADSEHCEYNILRLLNKEDNSKVASFCKYFRSKLVPPSNRFRQSIQREAKGENGHPNIANEFIRELFHQCNKTSTSDDFWKKIEPQDNEIMSDILDISKISFASNRYNTTKNTTEKVKSWPILKCFKEVFKVRTNAGNWMRVNHTILVAMQFVSTILSLHLKSFTVYKEKLEEDMHLRKQLSEKEMIQSSEQVDGLIMTNFTFGSNPVQRHFDFRFLCKFLLISYFY